ncbi:MAG: hypothetical protein QM813_03625 [Verrucomicrobiota bacterium]
MTLERKLPARSFGGKVVRLWGAQGGKLPVIGEQTKSMYTNKRSRETCAFIASVGLVLIAIGLNAVVASAATYHVRAGATGAANGIDWNNAYPTLPTTLLRGSTYYVAAGAYAGYTFNTIESGASLVTIKKATLLDHGSNTGWNDNYGSGPAVFTNYWQIARGYLVLDGQVGGGPQSWTNGYGFKIQSPSKVNFQPGISISDNRRYVTLRHIEVEGNGGDGDGGAGGQANDALSIGINTDFTTVSYVYLHDVGRCLIFGHGHNMFFEYVYGGRFESTDVEHAEIASLWASLPPTTVCTNVTFANCVWSHMEGTGGLIMFADGVKIYGNVFYRPANVTFPVAHGCISTWVNAGGVFARARIFNNAFLDLGSSFPAFNFSFGQNTGDIQVLNNIFYNCRVDFSNVTQHNYNLFVSSSGATASSESNGATAASTIFNDYRALNFTLKSNTLAGVAVGAPYDLDPNDATRTTWTRGAYEFGSGVAGVKLEMQRAGAQFVFSWPDTPASYQLCVTTNTALPIAWNALTNAPTLSNGIWNLSLPAPTTQRQFFRLQRQ